MSEQVTDGADLDDLRAATQELHEATTRTLSRGGSATRAEIEAVVARARDAGRAMRTLRAATGGPVRARLAEGLRHLEAVESHAVNSLGCSGQAVHATLKKALTAARAAAQSASEAVAAWRADESDRQPS